MHEAQITLISVLLEQRSTFVIVGTHEVLKVFVWCCCWSLATQDGREAH